MLTYNVKGIIIILLTEVGWSEAKTPRQSGSAKRGELLSVIFFSFFFHCHSLLFTLCYKFQLFRFL